MKDHYQLLIVGGGPAGFSAATVAADHGLDVALLDEQAAPGGQIYRAMESVPEQRALQLGDEYQRGRALVQAFRSSGAAYFPRTQVWSVSPDREIALTQQERCRILTADQVLISVGAMERPLPFPGWTLPGVMTAGAAQILFKAHGMAPDAGVVMAGTGPLLLLLAWQYMHAGVKVETILDTAPRSNLLHALPHLPKAMLAAHYITKGLKYQRDLVASGVSIRQNVQELRARGEHDLESVSFRHKGREQQLKTGFLLTHFGLIPNSHLARSAGCEHYWDNSQQCWRPELDSWGNSSRAGILIAGDSSGIGGARTAEHAGRLAAFQALYALGVLDQQQRDRLAARDRNWMNKDLWIRPFLEGLFRIPRSLLAVADDETVVCRCEEVTAGQIRQAVTEGHGDSNQVKFLTRCGMGPCQGRQCSDPVAQVVAAAGGTRMKKAGYYRVRPPVTPLTLGQLADLYRAGKP